MKPRVIADLAAFGRVFAQPLGRAGTGDRLVIEQLAIDLLADLDGIASVGEDCRRVRKHDDSARRSAETGQPVQPLGIAADVFAHVFVRDGDDESVESAPLEFLPQGGKAGFVSLHEHVAVLSHPT